MQQLRQYAETLGVMPEARENILKFYKKMKALPVKKLYTLLIIFFFSSSLFAQFVTFNQGKIKQKHYLQVIPYQEIKGILIVPVTINGKMYNFIFDTGAQLVISDKLYKELKPCSILRINMGDASGDRKRMKGILLPKIHLQEITFRNTPGVALHEDNKWFECLGIDGIIGSNMLRKSVVQFDEQNKQIIITDNIKNLFLQTNEFQEMKLLFFWTSNPYINITLQKGKNSAIHNVLFDTGDSDFFTLSLNELNACMADTIVESEGSFGLGAHGVYKKQNHLLLSIPEIEINGRIFNDVIVTTTHAHRSRIGTKLLEYGKTTLDYKKKHFYFEPYEDINTDELSKMPRAIFYTLQNNKMVVGIIWDKELESQINVGDEILSINGIDLQSMDFCELFMLEISDSDERILELRDINTGEIKKVENKRMQLIK